MKRLLISTELNEKDIVFLSVDTNKKTVEIEGTSIPDKKITLTLVEALEIANFILESEKIV